MKRHVLAALIVLAAACGSSDDSSSQAADSSTSSSSSSTSTSDTPPPSTSASTTTSVEPREQRTVDEALAAFPYGGGLTYGGSCAATNVDDHAGKAWCSELVDDRGSTRIYRAGPAFSEYDVWLLLSLGAGGWTVADTASMGDPENPSSHPW